MREHYRPEDADFTSRASVLPFATHVQVGGQLGTQGMTLVDGFEAACSAAGSAEPR